MADCESELPCSILIVARQFAPTLGVTPSLMRVVVSLGPYAFSLHNRWPQPLCTFRSMAVSGASGTSSSGSGSGDDGAPPPKKLLVLDLDETLIHSTVAAGGVQPDMEVVVTIDNQRCKLNVLKRPHVARFLRTVSDLSTFAECPGL